MRSHPKQHQHPRTQRPSKQLKPPTLPKDGASAQDGGSNPSPQSTDTARISSSSFGTIVAGGSEGRESRSASQDHQLPTPLTNWVDDSGWELVSCGLQHQLYRRCNGKQGDPHRSVHKQQVLGA